MHESSKITVYNSTWFYHFYAMVSSVIDNTCNNVATPKCISLEKEIFLIICRENRSNQGFHQDPENSNIKWLPRCPSGGHIFKEWQWNSLCRNFFLHFFFPHFFHSPSLAWIFFVLPQHFSNGQSLILCRDEGKRPTLIFYPAQFSLTMTLT